jgi:hypothetical protein
VSRTSDVASGADRVAGARPGAFANAPVWSFVVRATHTAHQLEAQMAPGFTCIDDPSTLLQKQWCLSALSKDWRGELRLSDSKPHQCHTPACKTLKTVHQLKVKSVAHPPCDAHAAASLDGELVVDRLVTVFDQDGMRRGLHAGDFVWNGVAGLKVTGRLSGITNVGTHRAPAFNDCQKCDERGVMEGRLCGRIETTGHAALNGCQVSAAYRIRFDPSATGGQGAVRGTLEGVILCSCQA